MSFVPIVDKKQLEAIIAAGEVQKQVRKLNTERTLAQETGYIKDAETQRRLQKPTLEAIAEGTAQALEDAKTLRKVIENESAVQQANNEKAIESLRKEIKALPGLPAPPAAEPIAAIDAPPGPAMVHVRGPLTAADFKKEIVGDAKPSGSTITPGEYVTYFGNQGATIAFSDAGNKKKVYLQRLSPDGEGVEDMEVEVSPAMADFINLKTNTDLKNFDMTRLSTEDKKAFESIRSFANYIVPGARDQGASADKKLNKLRVGHGLGEVSDAKPNISSPLGDFYIDPEHWLQGKLRVRTMKGGRLVDVLKGDLDPSFVKLMSERHNPRYQYSGHGIDLYRKFVQTTGAPVAKHSGKHKLVFGPKNDVDQLGLYMASMAAGNKSTETYNKAVELADKLYQLGKPDGLDKAEHDRLMETLAGLLAP